MQNDSVKFNILKYFKIFLFIFITIVFGPAFSANATTISPPVLEVELNPGETVAKNIKVFNETDNSLYLNGYVEIFKPRDESGAADIVPPEIFYPAINWLRLPLNVISLSPQESVTVPVIISVPKTADVGGYYLAVMWETGLRAPNPKGQLGISSRVGTLVLLKVKGSVREDLEIIDFYLTRSQKFYSHLPVSFSSRLENQGNVHLKPKGYLETKNIFGRVAAAPQFNQSDNNVLPQSIRKFETIWQKNSAISEKGGFFSQLKTEWTQFAIGRYSAQLVLEFGENHKRVYSKEISFWVIPWRLILVLIIVIAMIFVVKKALNILKSQSL